MALTSPDWRLRRSGIINDGVAVESPLMSQTENFIIQDAFEKKFLKRALEILESNEFENRLGLFYR